MKIFTDNEAKQKFCPIEKMSCDYCVGSKCMAWNEIEPRIERENHSGASAKMNEAALNRQFGAHVRIEGIGSQGKLILDARGCCGLIFKNEK